MLIEHDELRHYWYVVAEGHDLDSAPLAVRLLGADYVVWRSSNGELVAAPDRCPHRESPLSIGTVADGCLTCAYHGWKFGDGGACVEVPSSGVGRPVPPKAHLPTIHAARAVRPRVDLPRRARRRHSRRWPPRTIPPIAASTAASIAGRTSVTRMTDNFLDISHFPYVHVGTFGIQDNQDVPKIELEPLDDDFYGYRYEVEVGQRRRSDVVRARCRR